LLGAAEAGVPVRHQIRTAVRELALQEQVGLRKGRIVGQIERLAGWHGRDAGAAQPVEHGGDGHRGERLCHCRGIVQLWTREAERLSKCAEAGSLDAEPAVCRTVVTVSRRRSGEVTPAALWGCAA